MLEKVFYNSKNERKRKCRFKRKIDQQRNVTIYGQPILKVQTHLWHKITYHTLVYVGNGLGSKEIGIILS
jgi:hypothetical protein